MWGDYGCASEWKYAAIKQTWWVRNLCFDWGLCFGSSSLVKFGFWISGFFLWVDIAVLSRRNELFQCIFRPWRIPKWIILNRIAYISYVIVHLILFFESCPCTSDWKPLPRGPWFWKTSPPNIVRGSCWPTSYCWLIFLQYNTHYKQGIRDRNPIFSRMEYPHRNIEKYCLLQTVFEAIKGWSFVETKTSLSLKISGMSWLNWCFFSC